MKVVKCLCVILYGIASRISEDIEEWRSTREDAEAALAEVLADDPDLEDVLYVAEIEVEISPN